VNAFPDRPDITPEEPAASNADVPPCLPPEPSLPPAPQYPPWSGWDVLRITLMAVMSFFLVATLLMLSLPGATVHNRATALSAHVELEILGQMIAYVLVLGYMYILVTRERGQPRFWQAVRWNWPRHAWLFLFLGFLLQAAFMVIERFLPFPKETPFDALLQRPYSVALISVFSVTLGPLMEELFFRGFFYPVLRRRTGVAAAVVITAFPFALIHAAQYGYSWASVLLIFAVGVVLATVRENSDSLSASFLVHVGYNGTIAALMFVATDAFRHLEKLNQ